MHAHHFTRFRRATCRIGVVGAAALTVTLATAGTACAHAEVEADTPQALAANVTLSFVSEAESDSAGFTQLRIVLPEGIAPGDVSLDAAPKGWKLRATSDGYTVGGPALQAGVDAEHKIKVKQLPAAKEIAFKTVETYSDGKISRWIEVPSGSEEPDQPAPVLKLKAAASGAAPASPSPTATPTPTPTPTPSAAASATPDTAAKAAGKDEGSSAGLIIGGVVVALVVLGGGAWWLTKRRVSSSVN